MPTRVNRPHRLVVVALAALFVVGGCSVAAAPATQGPLATLDLPPTAKPTPTPPATPSPAATPSPTPTPVPSRTAKPTPKPDVASALRIGAPYKLVANPANQALTASMTFDILGTHIEAAFNGREIWQSGEMVGIALVIQMSGIEMTPDVFEASVRSAGNGEPTFSTILGERVAFMESPPTTVGMYVLDDAIVMVGGVDAAATKTLLTSVIKAN
jgi:hypothetical protein